MADEELPLRRRRLRLRPGASPPVLAAASCAGAEAGAVPDMRLASLGELKHPMSVDLWIDKVARPARVILVRILGGYDWWRYGADRLAAIAREHGIALALLPGESHERDERLTELSTLPQAELDALLSYFREGGPRNMRSLVRLQLRLAIGVCLIFAVLLGGLPLMLTLEPELAEVHVLRVPLPWVLLGVVVYPVMIAAAWLYVRQAERNERDFSELVQ